MSTYKSLIALSGIYVLTILFGLITAQTLIQQIYVEESIKPMVDDPSSPASTIQILLYIVGATGVMLVLIKMGLTGIIKAFMYLAFFSGTLITLTVMLGFYGVPLSLALFLLFIYRNNEVIVLDVCLIPAIAGLGAFLGASLDLLPALILLVALTVYDFLAVFKTKHMVTLAKSGDTLPFMVKVPVGGRTLGLGTGDLAIPLAFTVSTFRAYGMGYAIPTMLGGLMGLTVLFYYTTSEERGVLPALPPLAVGLLFGLNTALFTLG